MQEYSVRCRCNVQRVIDIEQVGPWRLRCKQCGDVLYDPTSPPRLQEPAARTPPDRQATKRLLEEKAQQILKALTPAPSHMSDVSQVAEDTCFQRWLQGSGELRVLRSSDGSKAPKCERHPERNVVAACTRCAGLLCKYCLDRIDDEFACSECVSTVAAKMDDRAGVTSWFKKIFGKKPI